MKSRKISMLAGALLLGFAGTAPAQDGGNIVAALDGVAANLNSTIITLLGGDLSATAVNLNETVGTLLVDLSDGSPLAPLAMRGAAIGDQLVGKLAPKLGKLSVLTDPLAKLLAPLQQAYIRNTPLTKGIPTLVGERSLLTGILPQKLIRVDLLPPGDNDGGGVLLGGSGAQPGVLKALLAGGGLQSFISVLRNAGSMLFRPLLSGGGLALGGPAGGPGRLGSLLGGGFPLSSLSTGGNSGMSVEALPLPANSLSPGARTALVNGVPLPGL